MDAYYKTNVETDGQAEILSRLLRKRIYGGNLRFDLNHRHRLLHAIGIKKTETDIITRCMNELGFSCELL